MTAVFVTGIVSGALYALAAMGLVVTYRSSGVFNFAHGAVGMFVAYCYWYMLVKHGLPMIVALPVSLLVIAPIMGIVLERLFHALKEQATAVKVVASLGVLYFLQNLAVVLFGPGNKRINPLFPAGTVTIGDVRVSYNQLSSIGIVVVTAIALTVLFKRTRIGLRMRAVVDNEDLVELSGLSADGVSRVAWTIGTIFAGGAGILLATFIGLDITTLTLVVIAAFAAAMFGRLVSLPLTALGAVLLALGESFVSFYAHGVLIGLRASLSFILLFLLLIVYQRRLPGEVRVGVVNLEERIWEPTRHAKMALVVAGIGVAFALPYVLSDRRLFNVDGVLVDAVILVSLVVLTGLSGQISLATASFVGIGAFTAGHVAVSNGGAFLWAVVLAAAIGAAVSLLVSLPSLRLSGLYLALATMAFALMMDNLIFQITRISGGLTGMQVPVPKVAGIDFSHTKPFYFLALGFLVAFGLFTGALRRSRTGRRLQALRDSPDGLRTLGVSLAATKLFVFAIAGAMASVGGVLLGVYQQEVGAQSFAMLVSVSYLVAVVLGGIGSVPGAVLGAFILAFPTFIQTSSGTFNNYFSLGIGLAVVQMARFPNGLISYYRSQGRSIAAFARRRREAALGTGVAVPAAAPEVVKVARRG